MKRSFSFLCALSLVTLLAACGTASVSDQTGDQNGSSTSSVAQSEQSSVSSEEADASASSVASVDDSTSSVAAE